MQMMISEDELKAIVQSYLEGQGYSVASLSAGVNQGQISNPTIPINPNAPQRVIQTLSQVTISSPLTPFAPPSSQQSLELVIFAELNPV